jgi:hypothetical protein
MKLRNTVLLAGAVAMAFSIPQAGLGAKAHWGKPVIQIFWGGGYSIGGGSVYPIRNNMQRNILRGILPYSAWDNKEHEKMTLSLIAQAYVPESVKAWEDAFLAREKVEKEVKDANSNLTRAQKRKIPKKTIDELEQEKVANLENRLNKSKLNVAVRKKDVPTIKTTLAALLATYTSETNTKFQKELNAIKAVQTPVPAPCTPTTTQLNCTPPVTPVTPVAPVTPVTPVAPVTTATTAITTPTGSSTSTTTVTGTQNSSSVTQTTVVTGDNQTGIQNTTLTNE